MITTWFNNKFAKTTFSMEGKKGKYNHGITLTMKFNYLPSETLIKEKNWEYNKDCYQWRGIGKRKPLLKQLLGNVWIWFNGERRYLRKLQQLGIETANISIEIHIHLNPQKSISLSLSQRKYPKIQISKTRRPLNPNKTTHITSALFVSPFDFCSVRIWNWMRRNMNELNMFRLEAL